MWLARRQEEKLIQLVESTLIFEANNIMTVRQVQYAKRFYFGDRVIFLL